MGDFACLFDYFCKIILLLPSYDAPRIQQFKSAP